jgi:hypothetical protein
MLGMRSVLPPQHVSRFLYSVRSHACDVPPLWPVTGRGFGKIGTAYFALAMEWGLWRGLRPFTRWPW